MDQQRVRKTFNYTLLPTPEQKRMLATAVWRRRELYTADLQERKAAWEKRRVCVSFARQAAQLSAIKEVQPDYRDRHAQVLQDVLHRLDNAFAACFRPRPGRCAARLSALAGQGPLPQLHLSAGGRARRCSVARRGAERVQDWPDSLRLHRPIEGTPQDGDAQP
jgi:hypothetical protein